MQSFLNGNVASLRTQEFTAQVMRESSRRLHKLGFYLADISGLQDKHIKALVHDWYQQGLSNKTMQNQFSRIKIFCGWIGLASLIKVGRVPGYLPAVEATTLRVSTVPIHDYAIAKSLSLVRPGGIVLLITSTGTMDKVKTNFREYMAERADLVKAIRLGNGSHAAIGGVSEAEHHVLDKPVMPVVMASETVANKAAIETPEQALKALLTMADEHSLAIPEYGQAKYGKDWKDSGALVIALYNDVMGLIERFGNVNVLREFLPLMTILSQNEIPVTLAIPYFRKLFSEFKRKQVPEAIRHVQDLLKSGPEVTIEHMKSQLLKAAELSSV